MEKVPPAQPARNNSGKLFANSTQDIAPFAKIGDIAPAAPIVKMRYLHRDIKLTGRPSVGLHAPARMNMTRTLFPSMLFAATILASLVQSSPAETTVTVAADGSGQFTKVQDAIMSVPNGTAQNRVYIRIKPGTYKELIYVQREKRFFHLVGEDAKTTILTYDLHANLPGSDGKPIGTFRTPSVTIDADDFTAENLTFENSAGPVGQALAIRVDGDRSVFRSCRFLGHQDTILLNRGRQYFEHCYIEGTTDFIFGGATAFFANCDIHCLKSSYITAAATPDFQPFGFVFHNCRVTAEPGVEMYLGRPWRDFAAVTFLNCELPAAIRPAGWHNWDLPNRESTARFAEHGNTGPGADTRGRVPWSRQLTDEAAAEMTANRVLGGSDRWIINGAESTRE